MNASSNEENSASPFSPAAMVPTTISVLGLSLVLFLPLIVPVDVFAAEREVHIGDFIRDLYYCTVAALLLFVLLLGPFAFFFHRQGEPALPLKNDGISTPDADSTWEQSRERDGKSVDDFKRQFQKIPSSLDNSGGGEELTFDPAPTLFWRACFACQQTWMCLCVMVGLVIGLIVLHASVKASQGQMEGELSGGGMSMAYDTVKSVKALFKSPETGTMALNLCVAGFVLLGMCGIIVYTALGLVALPIISCVRLGWQGICPRWPGPRPSKSSAARLSSMSSRLPVKSSVWLFFNAGVTAVSFWT